MDIRTCKADWRRGYLDGGRRRLSALFGSRSDSAGAITDTKCTTKPVVPISAMRWIANHSAAFDMIAFDVNWYYLTDVGKPL
jgi:hypothetical protein